jgi:Raf kinase inhibitor-like YbhB/YbcL family protein
VTLCGVKAQVAAAALTFLALTGCGNNSAGQGPSSTSPKATGADSLTITSPAFSDGGPIPVPFTCHGDNMTPPLQWSAPSDAASLALVVDDPDAPGGSYVHWVVTDIDGSGTTTAGQTPDGHSLTNSTGKDGYFGPCPPAGSGTHHYRFTLYALGSAPELPPGATGLAAAQAIADNASAQARWTGTVEG